MATTSRTSLRTTVNLNPRAVDALNEIASITGDTQNETINRAVQNYALAVAAAGRGNIVVEMTPDRADVLRVLYADGRLASGGHA